MLRATSSCSSKAAARRQAEAARELSRGDRLTELACDLIGEGLDASAVEQQRQLHASSLSDSLLVAMQRRRWTHGSDVNWRHRAFALCSHAQGRGAAARMGRRPA